jgi:hypothetical protein
MAKTKQLKRPRRKPGEWEQEFVAKYGLPVPIRVSAQQLAMLRWGMRRQVMCYSAQDEGARV